MGHTGWALASLSLLAAAETARAADTPTANSSLASLVNAPPEFIGGLVVNTIQTSLPVGARRLVVLEDLPDVALANAPTICGGMPAVIAHTPDLGGNGECFKLSKIPDLKNNLSCSCLTYLNKSVSEWSFRFRPVSTDAQTQLPKSIESEQILEIDSSLIYGVGTNVKTLRLVGVGDKPVPLQLRASPIPGTVSNDVALIISSQKATIQEVGVVSRLATRWMYIENVDLGVYDLRAGFVPNKLTNLTMKNCNLGTFSTNLLTSLGKLEQLDLSKNNLVGVYQDITKDTCVAAYCPIKAMNLSDNRIKVFPDGLFYMDNLMSLSLKANKITNFSVGLDVFQSMQHVKTLELDPFDNCTAGEPAVVASAKVCVYNITTEQTPAPAPAAPTSSGSTNALMYGVIGGCLIVAVLVFVLVKKRSCKSGDDDESNKEPLDAYFDNTLSYDDTHPTVSASLLNDPIIITNRIPYNEIRVANCISKGGFGLVYSGVYNRRRVAIKKIRPDRAGDIKMIEAFLKEICLMATLHHPHIVEFVGVSWDSLRNLCAVTEFMDRGDLREVLHGFKLRNSPLTWDGHKTPIALHIAEGLTYLHSLSPKVIHRDLKSKNVLLNSEMEAKLSDFGISRERHIEETHMTAGIGTSFWIAPEVLLGKDYDERADIFSFGVVLSEIDTDDYPYWNASNPNVGNKAQENMILQMVASGAMRPSFSESCPKAVLELADLCLQVEPSNRPTAAEVAYKLQQIVQFMNPVSDSTASGYY